MSDHHPHIPPSKFSVKRWAKCLKKRQDPIGLKVQHISWLEGPIEESLPYLFAVDSYASSIHFSGEEPEFVRIDADEAGNAIFRLQPGTVVAISTLKKVQGGKGYVVLEVLSVLRITREMFERRLNNLLQGPAPTLMQSVIRLIQLPKQKQLEAGGQPPDPTPPNHLPEGRDPDGKA